MLQQRDGNISLSLQTVAKKKPYMQIKDGNKPPENEQGVKLDLLNTITELVACAACDNKKKNKQI